MVQSSEKEEEVGTDDQPLNKKQKREVWVEDGRHPIEIS
jgi:hypothetical protein